MAKNKVSYGKVIGKINKDGSITPYIQEEDIAPVKETKQSGLFKSSDAANNWSLSTGNDFLDFLQRTNAAIWGTAAEATANVGRGVTNMVEGIGDFAMNRVADLQDLTGNSKEAEKTRRKSEEQWGLNKKLDEFTQTMNTTSVLGDFSDQVFQGVGSSLFAMGTGAIGGFIGGGTSLAASIASLGSMGVGAAGNSENEARLHMMAEMEEKGYTREQINSASKWYGLLSGTAETISEMMFGGIARGSKVLGIGKGLFDSADDAVIHTITNKIHNDLVKTFVQAGLKASGEGIEEIMSGLGNILAKKMTYMKDEDWGKLLEDEKLWESFLSGTLSALITQTPSIVKSANNTAKGMHTDYITGLSHNEEKVIDKLVEQRVAQETTSKSENQIRKEVTNQMKNLELSTREISRALGEERLEGNMADSFLNQIVANEHTGFALTQNESKNIKTEKQQALLKDLDGLNNSKTLHNIYNRVNAIQGVNDSQQYHITTTEGLHKLGIINKNANGEYTMKNGKPYVPRGLNYKDGAIYINADVGLQSGTQAIFHEMFEGFKKASPTEYSQFKDMVREIVGEKAIQDEIASYKEMYEDVYNEDVAKYIEDEIINDKFGELAESNQFVDKIAGNRNVLERFVDAIKRMIKYVKGTPEEKRLMKLQDNLEKKFTELYKNTDFSKNAKGKTALSLTGQEAIQYAKDLKKELTQAKSNLTRAENEFKLASGAEIAYDYESVKLSKGEEAANKGKANARERATEAHEKMVEAQERLYNAQKAMDDFTAEQKKAFEESYGDELAFSLTSNIQGLEDYGRNEIKQIATDYIKEALNLSDVDADIVGMEIIGSRNRGNANQNSDLDIVVELSGEDLREDSLFEVLNDVEEPLEINGIKVDFNPILAEKSGTLEEFMSRSNQYDKEVLNKNSKQVSNKDSQGRELSKQQQNYFKDSKIRDNNGNLIVMYHGTPYGGFNEFNDSHFGSIGDSGYFGKGFYFTDNRQLAEDYSDANFIPMDERTTNAGEYGNVEVKEVYLDIKNPYIIDGTQVEYENGALEKLLGTNDSYESTELLKEQGYDGVVYEGKDSREVTAFEPNQIKNIDNINPTSNNDIRYSLTASEANTGVDNRNKKLSKEQQEYFKDSKIRDKNGKLLRVYHGSDNEFNTFDLNHVGEKLYPAFGEGFYFDSDKSTAKNYTGANGVENIKAVYLDIKNPYYASDSEVGTLHREELIKQGYDGVSVYGHEFVAFYPEQIKSIENIAPTSNPDIRYSLIDNQGRELSKQQQNFFRNSQARDYNGALLELYHGTNSDFNIFERGTGEHGDGYYFTDDYDYAEQYTDNVDMEENVEGGIMSAYLNLENPLSESVNLESQSMKKFIKGIEQKWGLSEKEITDCFKDGKLSNYDWSSELGSKVARKMGYSNTDVENIVGFEINDPYDMGIHNYNAYLGSYAWQNGLNQLARESGFDGIISHVYNDATDGYEYIAFKPEQIKNIDNTNPTSDPDIRYSLSKSGELQDSKGKKVTLETSDTGTSGSLMAIHNLGESQLKGIMELGGFPYPSIAITNPDIYSHEGFGDISVLFDKSSIDPALDSKNKVYARDAYTPRFPSLEYKINSDVESNIRNIIGYYDYRNATAGDSYITDAQNVMNELERNINNRGLEATLDDIKNNTAMKYVYLKSIDPSFEVNTKSEQFSYKYDNATLQKFLDNYKGEYDLNELPSSDYDKYANTMWKAYSEQLKNEYKEKNFDTKTINELLGMAKEKFIGSFAERNNFAMAAYKLQKYGAEHQVLDSASTQEKINNTINQEQYNKWVDNLFENIIEKKGLRNNKDYYTDSGNPRSFEQLHEDYTLDNAVKILNALEETGAESGMFSGIGQIAGNAAMRFDSIQDIKANENLLTNIGSEEYSTMLESISNRLSDVQTDIIEKGHNNSDNYFIAMDNMASAIAETARTLGEGKKLTAQKVMNELNDYGFNPTIEECQQIVDLVNEMRKLPTQYFEAKPKRGVGLDEVEAIVIPNTLDADFKKQLQDKGLKYYEYDPSIEGDRQRVINQFDELKFSLTSNQDITPREIAPLKQGMFTYGGEEIAPVSNVDSKEATENIAPINVDEDIQNMTADDINLEPFLKGIQDSAERQETRNKMKEELNTKKEVFLPKERSGFKKFIDTLKEMFVNKNVEIDNLARDYRNPQIKFLADMLNSTAAEAQTNLNLAQTDNNGKTIGRGLRQIFNDVRNKGLYDAFNDYLLHWSNIDRHKQGKGSKVSSKTSYKIVKEYEAKYPIFKKLGKEVWNYSRNARHNLRDAGIISEGLSKRLGAMYPHYVPYISTENDSYFKDITEIKPLGVIKHARGGANQDTLLAVEEALTRYTYAQKKSVRQNELYKEIVNTIGDNVLIGGDTGSDYVYMDDSLYRDVNGTYLTAYENGEAKTTRISDELFRSLSGELEKQVKDLEQRLSFVTKPLQTLSKIRRDILTKWSLTFPATNALKDVQDAVFNSKYTADFIKNYPTALLELRQNTELARQFKALYGSGLEMGQYDIDSGLYNPKKGAKNFNFLKGVENANELIELAPRFAEFKSSIQNGATLQEAMYNAREVTTNFSRGGVIAKAMNRNGFTFLNASIQGFDKFIRNFSGENGVRGVVSSLAKSVIFGVAPAVFNELAFGWGDDKDEDYEVLPDYIKDNYYLFKTGDGKFIRIPKGRVLSVFGSAARRTLEMAQGEEDAFKGFLKNVDSQIGINNPEENNIFAPLIQAYGSKNGEAWYGGDIVPTRLQNKPASEQYDSSIDNLSIWLGDKLGVSPYKLNYVLDQYTGGFGDIAIPMMTEEATSGADSLGEYLVAPIKDKFTADSTTDNKYVSDFYSKNDELTIKANSDKATDEDMLRKKYMSHVSSEMSELYKQRREIQSDNSLSKEEKFEKAQAIKDEINRLAKVGVKGYDNLDISGDYAVVNDDMGYYKNAKGEWTAINQADIQATEGMGLTDLEKSKYYGIKNDFYNIEQDYKAETEGLSEEAKKPYSAEKKRNIVDTIKASGLPDEAKAYLYETKYNDNLIESFASIGVDMDNYLEYKAQNFTADKDKNGKSISGSKKQKVYNYVNHMNIPLAQKAMIMKSEYESFNTYNFEIIEYIYNSDISYEEKLDMLKKLGFKVDGNRVTW